MQFEQGAEGKECKHKHQRRPRESSQHRGKTPGGGESKRPSGQHSHTPGGNRSGPGVSGNDGGSNAAKNNNKWSCTEREMF